MHFDTLDMGSFGTMDPGADRMAMTAPDAGDGAANVGSSVEIVV